MQEQLTDEHRKASALAQQLSDSEPGEERDAALADLDRLLTTHLTVEQQFLTPVLGRGFKGASEFKASTEFKASSEVVPDALPAALAALTHGGPDTDFPAATSMLVKALNEHVHHVEQDLFPLLGQDSSGGPTPSGTGEAMPPGEVAPGVTRDEVAEVEAEHKRGT